MNRSAVLILLLSLVHGLGLFSGASAQTLDKEQREELKEIEKSLVPVGRMIIKKEYDQAEQILNEAQKGVERIEKFAQLPVGNRLTAAVRKTISSQRHTLELKRDPVAAREKSLVSFVRHVAPILNKKCVSCHAESPQGGLRLNTFENMKKGGRSGPLLIPGNANNSLFMLRLCTPNSRARMPKNDDALSAAERNVVGLWIQQGARYDAEHEDTELEDLIEPPDDLPPLQAWRPTGKESVSFKRDISPWIVTYCLRCHTGKKPKGGLSMDSYDALRRGGDSGPAIIPGRPEESPMYQLVGSFDATRRMPANTSRLERRNWDDLGVWIHEGATFDGGEDPKMLLRALTPDPEDVARDKLAKMSPEELAKYREERTGQQWSEAFADEMPKTATTTDLLLYGNVSAEQIETLAAQAEEHLAKLREMFAIEDPETPLWKGRLAVFILKSRSDFEEFAEKVTQRRVFDDNHSVSRLDTTLEDAYLVLYLPPEAGADDEASPPLSFMLASELTALHLLQQPKAFPQWFTLGFGTALAARSAKNDDPWVLSQYAASIEPLKAITRPADIFKDGVFFSDEEARPVSQTLVQFLIEKGGGELKLRNFIEAFQKSGSGTSSLQFAYGASLDTVARSYFGWIQNKAKPLLKK